MSKVHFKKNIMESLMLDPRQEFKQVKIQSELRFDPLTGNSSRVAHFGNWKTVTPDLNHLDTEENHRNCPFCPGNIDRRTPHFPQGYFFSSPQAGEATVIPNLMPYEKHSALVIISKRHLIPINKLAPVLIADALQVAVMYIRRIREIDVNTPYSLIGWNYMPPSGGSQVHPHLQVFTGINPGNLYRQELEACQRYRREKGGSYWQDLVQTEKELKERYLGNSGSWEWITAFAPLGMAGDIMAVHKDDLAEMGYRDLLDLAEGMLKIFRYLDGQGIYSFNLGLFPPPKADPAFATHLRLIPRVTINPRLEVPDANVFQMVFQEPICVIRPEELAESIPWK